MNATYTTGNYWRYGRNIMAGALAAVAVAILGASQAQAEEDGKVYPASMCVRFGGTNPVLNASRLFNHGTLSESFRFGPMVRPKPHST